MKKAVYILLVVVGLMICSSSSAFADVSSENCSGKPELNRCLHCGELHSAKTFKAEAKSVSDHVPPLETPLGQVGLAIFVGIIVFGLVMVGAELGWQHSCSKSRPQAPDVK